MNTSYAGSTGPPPAAGQCVSVVRTGAYGTTAERESRRPDRPRTCEHRGWPPGRLEIAGVGADRRSARRARSLHVDVLQVCLIQVRTLATTSAPTADAGLDPCPARAAYDRSAGSAMTNRLIRNRLKPSESASAQSVVAVTRSDLLTIC